jgi:hypothetical protein
MRGRRVVEAPRGDKRSQEADIAEAKKLAKEYAS